MMKVYNSTFETMLRLLCLLSSAGCKLGKERIILIDFIATFGEKYHIAAENLNGEYVANAAELAARRVRIQRALKKMVQLGYVIPEQNNVFFYQISSEGDLYAQALNSDYAKTYRNAVNRAIQVYSGYTDAQLMMLICGNNGGTEQ